MTPPAPPGLAVAVWRSVTAPAPEWAGAWSWGPSWPLLGPALATTSKASAPLWSPTVLRPGASRRASSEVEALTALVLDVDASASAEAQAATLDRLDALARAGVGYHIHTTFSHSPEAPAWRAIIPLSRPVSVADWPRFWRAATASIAPAADPHCSDPCRAYYVPSHPPDMASHAVSYMVPGGPLDPDAYLTPAGAPTAPMPREPIERERLERLALKWQKSKVESRSHLGHALARALRGEPYAPVGARDTTLFQLSRDIIREIPTADPASIAALFAAALSHDPGGPTVDVLSEKLARAAEHPDLAPATVAGRMAEVWRVAGAPDRSGPYTPADLSHPQVMADFGHALDAQSHEWVLQYQRSHYYMVIHPDRGPVYHGPFGDDARLAAHTYLSTSPVPLHQVTPSGGLAPRHPLDIALSHGTVLRDVRLDLRAQRQRYEPHARTLVEAPCPIRSITPRRSFEVETWLRILTGDPETFHKVTMWMSHITDLSDIAPVLLLTGPPGCGKSLLAIGLSRIWTEHGPSTLDAAMAQFNDGITRCPLVLGDEGIPHDHRGRPRTQDLRRIVSERVRPLRRKFVPEAQCEGALRVMVTANNEDVLSLHEDLSTSDIQAVADRILHVEIPPIRGQQAARYLATLDTSTFVDGDALAAHALWLAEQRALPEDERIVKGLDRQGRFLFASTDPDGTATGPSPLAVRLAVRGGWRSSVCQWICAWLLTPRILAGRVRSEADRPRIDGSRVIVTPRVLHAQWDAYHTAQGERKPSLSAIARAWDALADGGRGVHLATLSTWASSHGYASREDLARGMVEAAGGRK